MTGIDQLFLDTCVDLQNRVESTVPYEILGASSLIRKLLIDGHCLVDRANKLRRLKIRFTVGCENPLPEGTPEPFFWTMQDSVFPPKGLPNPCLEDLTRDQFLSHEIMSIQGRRYTIREIVLFEANVMGGVHAGDAQKDSEQLLDEIGNHFHFFDRRAPLAQLRGIGRAVCFALKPLYTATKNGYA